MLAISAVALALVSAVIANFGCVSKSKSSSSEIRILTYSSLGASGGFLDSIKSEFETESSCKLVITTTMGASQILSYLDEPKQREQIDLVMGIDTLLFERTKSDFYLGDPPHFQFQNKILPILKSQFTRGFIPTDFGALSFIYRKADFKEKTIPSSFDDFLKPELKGKWIVQDPRASSPGLLFFLFADSLLANFANLKTQWATLAPSWDSSYKMFMAHDSSMVWSYLTSLAYHASKGEKDQYGSIDFKEGLPIQLEGMAVLNRVGNPYLANPCIEKWMQFILSPGVQTKMSNKQYMMPAIADPTLPPYFNQVPAVKKIANLELSLEKVDHVMNRFEREVSGGSR
jgi:thiamine transport system substrate-binding protein